MGVSSNASKTIQAQTTLDPLDADRLLPAGASQTPCIPKKNRPWNKRNQSKVGVLVLVPIIARFPLLLGRRLALPGRPEGTG